MQYFRKLALALAMGAMGLNLSAYADLCPSLEPHLEAMETDTYNYPNPTFSIGQGETACRVLINPDDALYDALGCEWLNTTVKKFSNEDVTAVSAVLGACSFLIADGGDTYDTGVSNYFVYKDVTVLEVGYDGEALFIEIYLDF